MYGIFDNCVLYFNILLAELFFVNAIFIKKKRGKISCKTGKIK